MDRRTFLAGLAGTAAMVATPVLADRQCFDAITRRSWVNLEVVAMARNERFYQTIESSSRAQRVFETGPRIYEGIKAGRFKRVSRPITVTAMFWMKSGFESVQAVHDNVAQMEEFQFTAVGNNLDCSLRTATFVRNFDQLPTLVGVSGKSRPSLAMQATIRAYGIGWSLSYEFLTQVRTIMLCPDRNTLWPRRTGGEDEGLIITQEEINGWMKRRETFALAGMMDSE